MTFLSISATDLVLLALTASELAVQLVLGHGRVMEPPNRASLYRFPEFAHLDPPRNYEDNQLFCGGFDMQYNYNGGKCGVCGDPYNETVPRTHEDGGENYRGIIVRGYRSGQVMQVEVDITATHLGYLEFRLCANDDKASHLTQECYDKHLLKIVKMNAESAETRYIVPIRGEPYYARYQLKLPKGVSCKHCVLQWHYQTGNRWGNCSDGTEAMGCGNQEVFRSCSDIIIYPENTEESNVIRRPNSKFGVFRPQEEDEGENDSAPGTESSQNVPTTNSGGVGDNFYGQQFFNKFQHMHPIHG